MLPLNGVRVLAVEQYGAGPFGTMFLADQGAEVIKIENPNDGGDMSRAVGPYFFAPGDSEFFHSFNRNKKSLTLDLSRPEGQAVLHDLVRTADALASNLRGDVPAKLGLVYENLKAHNPKIVCAHLSAYGRTGPRAAWPGFDYLMQAEAGYFALTGEPVHPRQPTERVARAVHDHSRRSGLLIVIGDAIHNTVDGVAIAAAFLTDARLGVITTLAVIAHEIPQEVGDFVILLHAGYTKRKALLLNLLASFTSVAGGIAGYFVLQQTQAAVPYVLAVSAASFIYIAVADLIPDMHRSVDARSTAWQVALIAVGVATIALLQEIRAGH